MAIFDEIQDRLRKQQQGLNSMAPAVGAQSAMADAARAGTGKATASGAPRASNVGEQVAAGAVQAQASQLAGRIGASADRLSTAAQAVRDASDAGAAKLAATQSAFQTDQAAKTAAAGLGRATTATTQGLALAGQEQRALATAGSQFRNRTADLATDSAIQRDDLFAQFRQGTQELAFRKDGAQLEQLAQELALGDRKYVDQLVQVGTLRRLDDYNTWKDEMQRLTLGQKLDDALTEAQFRVDLNADQRAWNEQWGTFNEEMAFAVLMAEMQGKNASTLVNGVGGLVKTGVDAYNKPDAPPGETSGLTDIGGREAGSSATGATRPGGSP